MSLTCGKHLQHNRFCDGCQDAAIQEGYWSPEAIAYRAEKIVDETLLDARNAVLELAEAQGGGHVRADPEDDYALLLDSPTGETFRVTLAFTTTTEYQR